MNNEQDILQAAMCPMCHTPASVTRSAVEAGGHWPCSRCGQHWDASRLAAVAAYAEWAADRDRAGTRGRS
jgi:ribosomal protein L37AE/L43A